MAVEHVEQAAGPSSSRRERKTEARQRLISEHVIKVGSCTAQELAATFGVSIMTIHRDLDALEHRGIVRKFRGGVTARPSGVFESQLSYRMTSNEAEKSAIAKVALEYVEPGMSVMLDDSTTILRMLPGLAELAPLHVTTTFLTALSRLSELATQTDLTIIGLGGVYDVPHDSFVGMQCIEQISGIRTDVLFTSTSAVSGSYVFHQEERIVELKRAMLQAATKRYLLVDHTKLGRVALHRVVPLDVFDLVITDSGVDPAVLDAWTASGIKYRVAAVDTAATYAVPPMRTPPAGEAARL
jgi:DeoR/GlpR family transcriptional regulator of sugar metabolism